MQPSFIIIILEINNMDPNKMTTLLGYEIDEMSRSMIIDLCIASVVIFFIMLPTICFRSEGTSHYKPKLS